MVIFGYIASSRLHRTLASKGKTKNKQKKRKGVCVLCQLLASVYENKGERNLWGGLRAPPPQIRKNPTNSGSAKDSSIPAPLTPKSP